MNKMTLPDWNGQVDVSSLQLYGTLMKRFGLLKQPPSLGDVVAKPGASLQKPVD